MNVRELIRKDFGVDLPISGGFGSSVENAVVLEYEGGSNDYVGTEYAYLKYIGLGRGIKWKTLKQELVLEDNRKFDMIKIETKQITDDEIITQVENYYFDITECFGR
jgi:hypothetical protein